MSTSSVRVPGFVLSVSNYLVTVLLFLVMVGALFGLESLVDTATASMPFVRQVSMAMAPFAIMVCWFAATWFTAQRVVSDGEFDTTEGVRNRLIGKALFYGLFYLVCCVIATLTGASLLLLYVIFFMSGAFPEMARFPARWFGRPSAFPD